MTLRTASFLLLGLGGCPDTVRTVEPVMGEVDAGGASAVSVESVVGVGTVEVPIRLINDYGAAIPGGTATLSVDGPTAAIDDEVVAFDGSGFATVSVSTEGAEAFVVTVGSTDVGVTGGVSATSYAVAGEFPALQVDMGMLLPSGAQNPDFTAEATNGLAVAKGEMVYWVPARPGQPAYAVATLPFDVEGLWSANIDNDGVLDLVLWGADQAIFLRGHDGGGFAWGAGWQADSGEVVGVAANDFDGDRLTDIAVGITGDVSSSVQILTGDGAWGFEPTEVLEQNLTIMGLAAADEGPDGAPDVTTLVTNSGYLRRYALTDAGWVGATGPELGAGYLDDYGGDLGTVLLPETDLDGDGLDDFVMVGAPGTNQTVELLVISDGVTYIPTQYNQAHVVLVDLNDAPPIETAILDADGLTILHYQGDTAENLFGRWNVTLDGDPGPVAFVDVDADGIRDALVATETVNVFGGSVEDGVWDTATWTWGVYGANLSGPVIYGDFNEDGFVDAASLSDASGQVVMKMWGFYLADTEIRWSSGDEVELGDIAAESLDVCVVDGQPVFYAVSSASTSNTLHRIRFNPSSEEFTLDASEPVAGPYAGCGDFGSGEVAVSNAAGAWTAYVFNETSGNLAETAEFDEIGPVYAVTSADTDGDGVTELVGCSSSGCTIASGDTDGDGDDEVVTSGEALELFNDGEAFPVQGTGEVSLSDVDGDGLLDVLAVDSEGGRVYISRSVAGGITPPVVLHTSREITGPATLGDINGDGNLELVVATTDGSIAHTAVTP